MRYIKFATSNSYAWLKLEVITYSSRLAGNALSFKQCVIATCSGCI